MIFANEVNSIQIGATESTQEKRLSASDVLRTVDDVGKTGVAGNASEIDMISLSRLFINANAFVESIAESTHGNSYLLTGIEVVRS